LRPVGFVARRIAYDGLLLRRLGQRGEPPADFGVDAELPGEDEVLLDTALYHAAAARGAEARALVRRDRLTAVAVVALAGSLVAAVRFRG